ncbi:MAG: hypothetical protein EOM87_03095 [Clostridia bacterium]|nr:hypothetical protein [Clostridia bacterium]
MALTDIASKLKETFGGFNVVGGIQDELKIFRSIYGEAESIRIGEMDYIVINQKYRSEEYDGIPTKVSPLFFNSINHNYAIIDAETSSTLIDEVYSRVTYMQRICKSDADPDAKDIASKLKNLIGDTDISSLRVEKVIARGENSNNDANIFQCHLIKDTGVSATPDIYSFMLKNGEIKEISDSVIKQIKRSGVVKMLSDRDALDSHRSAIQKAVFDKYMDSDIDIQSVNVKSIFEISLSFLNVRLLYSEPLDVGTKTPVTRNAVFNTVYIASTGNEFDPLNENIHICDSCRRDIVDVNDASKIYKIHINTDAKDENCSTDGKTVYATGCEDCLTRCEECGSWHIDYEKFAGSQAFYSKLKLVQGRDFVKSLRSFEDINYCACRECIEWIYDEKTGTEKEHDVIAIENMAFINYAGEKIASYADYLRFFKKEKGKKNLTGAAEHIFAKNTFSKFRRELSVKTNIDIDDIIVTSAANCRKCTVCSGEFYSEAGGFGFDAGVADTEFRCDVCREMATEKVNMVTRIDGTVFLRSNIGKQRTVGKYIVTKFGNLKKISSVAINIAKPSDEDEFEEPTQSEATLAEAVAETEDELR